MNIMNFSTTIYPNITTLHDFHTSHHEDGEGHHDHTSKVAEFTALRVTLLCIGLIGFTFNMLCNAHIMRRWIREKKPKVYDIVLLSYGVNHVVYSCFLVGYIIINRFYILPDEVYHVTWTLFCVLMGMSNWLIMTIEIKHHLMKIGASKMAGLKSLVLLSWFTNISFISALTFVMGAHTLELAVSVMVLMAVLYLVVAYTMSIRHHLVRRDDIVRIKRQQEEQIPVTTTATRLPTAYIVSFVVCVMPWIGMRLYENLNANGEELSDLMNLGTVLLYSLELIVHPVIYAQKLRNNYVHV